MTALLLLEKGLHKISSFSLIDKTVISAKYVVVNPLLAIFPSTTIHKP